MTGSDDLARRHRLLLWWFPRAFRDEYGSELIGVLQEGTRSGRRRAGPVDYLDLIISGIRMRARLAITPSERSATRAIPMMYLGALLELVAAVTILATAGDIRASLVGHGPPLTDADWAAVMTRDLEPVAVAACVGAVVSVGLAWAMARSYRWPRFVLAAFLGVNVFGLISGLVQGSATTARADLVAGTALCVAQCVAVGLAFPATSRALARLGSIAGWTPRPRHG